MEDLCSETLAVTRRPLRTNLFRPSLLPAFWIFFFFFPFPFFPFFFFFFFLSFLFLSRPCTRTRTRAVSHVHTYMHALTHSHQLSFSWVPGKGQEEGKLVGPGVGRRPHPTPPHPTPLHVNLRALWSVLESSDLRAGQRQRDALPLPPFLSL